jgi:hypothetical protein
VELIEIQLSATVALLLGHFIGVMCNRWRTARSSPLYVSPTSWRVKWEPVRRNGVAACETLADRRATRASLRPIRRG